MNVNEIKNAMLKMSDDELFQIIQLATHIKSISPHVRTGMATDNVPQSRLSKPTKSDFSVGQKVDVVQKTKTTPAKILKLNPRKAVVEMNWQGQGLTEVSVPYAMLEAV